ERRPAVQTPPRHPLASMSVVRAPLRAAARAAAIPAGPEPQTRTTAGLSTGMSRAGSLQIAGWAGDIGRHEIRGRWAGNGGVDLINDHMASRYTMADVARAAGVHQTTVSLALRNQ